MSTRDDFAAALSTVEDVTGYAYRPTTPRAGDAWPLLSSLDRGPGFTFEVGWRVLVWLPSDPRAASDWVDEHAIALAEALNPVAYVDRIEPVSLAVGSGDQVALQITMRE